MKNLCLIITVFVFSTVLGVAQQLSEVEFSYTGAVQEWTVPEGITYMEFEMAGARGGATNTDNNGEKQPAIWVRGNKTRGDKTRPGFGGIVEASTTQIAPGTRLSIYVGGAGLNPADGYFGASWNDHTPTITSGWNGGGANIINPVFPQQGNGIPPTPALVFGGGGGATDIRVGGNGLDHRILVAGGGGGAAADEYYTSGTSAGGHGGGDLGADGYHLGGKGGSQTSGGAKAHERHPDGISAGNGSKGQGGRGELNDYYYAFANGKAYRMKVAGGGGGGGYFGGGGGTAGPLMSAGLGFLLGTAPHASFYSIGTATGGGGGSSYTDPSFFAEENAVHTRGGNNNHGYLKIRYAVSSPAPTPNFTEPGEIRFDYQNGVQYWTVPPGITKLEIEAAGAKGGAISGSGGAGGLVSVTTENIPVGTRLNIFVGERGVKDVPAWNGGGGALKGLFTNASGGGATDIRIGGHGLDDRVLVAGGGGGSGKSTEGGRGGGLTGANGGAGERAVPIGNGNHHGSGYTSAEERLGLIPGGGGTQTGGGRRGIATSWLSSFFGGEEISNGREAEDGEKGVGGGIPNNPDSSLDYIPESGGGGGGYYGGGGGGLYAGGGGGSSYTNPDYFSQSEVTHTQGGNSETTGYLIIRYSLGDVPVITTPVNGGLTAATTTISGFASTPGATVTVTVSNGQKYTAIVGEQYDWSVSVPLDSGNGANDGAEYTASATQTLQGNTLSANSHEVSFTVDALAPQAPVITSPGQGELSPAQRTFSGETGFFVLISGSGEAGSRVQVREAGEELGTTIVGEDSNWTLTPSVALGEGSHTLEALQVDPPGNTSPSSPGVTFSIVASLPVFTAPGEGDEASPSQRTISGSGEPGAWVVVSEAGDELGRTIVGEDGNWTLTLSDALGEGSHTLTALQVDKEGNGVGTDPISGSLDPDSEVTFSVVNSAPGFDTGGLTAAYQGSEYRYEIGTSDAEREAVTVTASGLPDWLELQSAGTDMPQFALNGGAEVSGGILTLTDDQYADIPAGLLGDWPGTQDFEFSVEIKAASGSNIAANSELGEAGHGSLMQRSIREGVGKGHGPMMFLWNNGKIQVRITGKERLEIANAVDSWDEWVKLKFVLNATDTPKTLKIFVNDVEKGSHNLTNWQYYLDIADTFRDAPMRLGGHYENGVWQSLNAQIRNIYISGVSSTGYVLRGTPTEAGEHPIVLTATDSEGNATTQEFTIRVTQVVPVPVAASAVATEDGSAAAGQLAASHANGSPLSYALDAPVAGLTLETDGSYSFDPSNAAYQSLPEGTMLEVMANWTVTDNVNESASSTLTITVTGVNDPPAGNAATAVATEDAATVGGQLVATDSDNDATFSYALDASVAGLTLETDGSYSFDPSNAAYQLLAEEETQEVVANWRVTDDQGASASSTLTITVTGVRDVPVAVSATAVATESGTALAGQLAAIHDNGTTLSYALDATVPGLTLNLDGSYNFDPSDPTYQSLAKGQTQEVVASWTATDNNGLTGSGTLTITVTGTNLLAVAATATATEDGAAVGGQLQGTDEIDPSVSYALDAPVAGLTLESGGAYSFDPSNAAYQSLAEGATQDVLANWKATDDQGASVSSTLTITVSGTNDAPVAVAATAETTAGSSGAPVDGSMTFEMLWSNQQDPLDTISMTIKFPKDSIADRPSVSVDRVPGSVLTIDYKGAVTTHLEPMIVWTASEELDFSRELIGQPGFGWGEGGDFNLFSVEVADGGFNGVGEFTVRAPNSAGYVLTSMKPAQASGVGGQLVANDADGNATLTYTLDEAVAGLTVNEDGSYSFDGTDQAYRSLREGTTLDVVANWTVTDEHEASGSNTLTITVTGTATEQDARIAELEAQLAVRPTQASYDALGDALVAMTADRDARLTLAEVQDARVDSIVMAKDPVTGVVTLCFDLQKSDDFISWIAYGGGTLNDLGDGQFKVSLPLGPGKEWLRMVMKK